MDRFLSWPLALACAALVTALPRSGAGQSTATDREGPVVMVNQSGYNLEGPKRFTAPVCAAGTRFIITTEGGSAPLFSGQVREGVGDFSAFRPRNNAGPYVVRLPRSGDSSYPFAVAPGWLERAFSTPALDYMIDARSVVGTHPSAYGGCPWRDATYYSFEVPSLVMLYMANPRFFLDKAPSIDYAADKARVLSPTFHEVPAKNGQDALEDVRRYYRELDPPQGEQVPDIVQLIHWGIGFYLIDPQTEDPSGGPDGNRIHPQTVEQFAFFLYVYPMLKKYFSERFYQQAHDFAFAQWEKTGLFKVNTTIGDGKGRECPGHSILPNLLMYAVARREHRADSGRFLQAAYDQTAWVIRDLDWRDPRTTKGQRMSEHKLLPGLVYFLQRYPEQAPPGLRKKISDWADIMIARSRNLWDFRRYDTVANWSIPEYNEPGNLAGFPACALSAASVLPDPARRARLEQLAYAAWDNLFGRTPLNAASPHHPEMGFPALERGWPKAFPADVCARLETVRGTLNSSCGTEMYPYNPAGAFRHPEGWTAFNAAWNVGLAFMSRHDTRLQLMDAGYRRPLPPGRAATVFHVQLQLPAGSPGDTGATVYLRLISDRGEEHRWPLTERTPGSGCFQGLVDPGEGARTAGAYGNHLRLAYGEGFLATALQLERKGEGYALSGAGQVR